MAAQPWTEAVYGVGSTEGTMETVKIRNLTEMELRTLRTALETLRLTTSGDTMSTMNWASEVMLENDAKFLKQLLWIEKGSIA